MRARRGALRCAAGRELLLRHGAFRRPGSEVLLRGPRSVRVCVCVCGGGDVPSPGVSLWLAGEPIWGGAKPSLLPAGPAYDPSLRPALL